jgi:hypothetical protein
LGSEFGVTQAFLVERYWPGVTREALEAAIRRGKLAAVEMASSGRPVEHLRTTLVPTDEAVFSLFAAGSADDVAELNRLAEFPFDRIAEAIAIESEAAV